MSEAFEISPWQQRSLSIPEEYDVFLGGGRGSGKAYAIGLDMMRHAEQHKEKARMLYVRRTYKGLADFEDIVRSLFGLAYGKGFRYNASEHTGRFANGAYLELGQLETPADYGKYQGRSFTRLYADEVGQYASPDLLDLLRSNLRGPKDLPIRAMFAANPGDAGHHWIAQRFVFRATPWEPFYEDKSKRHWVYAPGTYRDNPFIDQEEYRAQLEASCPHDPELLRAWLEGDWAVARGAFFASVVEESRNAVGPWCQPEDPKDWAADMTRRGWRFHLAHDYGSAAPSVTYICARSPGIEGPDGRFYPRESLVLIDELATNVPGTIDQGMNYTVPRLAEEIREMCSGWGIRPDGVADDACFNTHGHQVGSIADEFRKNGVHFRHAHKGDRISGWQKMRTLLANAGQVDVPGLYVGRNCEYFWATVPFLGRDPRRAEDIDTRTADHAADACRYGLLSEPSRMVRMKLVGL